MMSTNSIEHKIMRNHIYYQCTEGLSAQTRSAQCPNLEAILLHCLLFLSCPKATAPRTSDSNIIFVCIFIYHLHCSMVISYLLLICLFAFSNLHSLLTGIRLLSLWWILQCKCRHPRQEIIMVNLQMQPAMSEQRSKIRELSY